MEQHPLLVSASQGQLANVQEALAKLDIKTPAKDISDAEGKNALHMACQSGNLDVIKHLLESDHDFDVDSKDNKGTTPLDIAAAAAHPEAVKTLIASGCNVHLASSAVHSAASKGSVAILQSLLEAGASPDTTDPCSQQMPPLFLAAAMVALKSRDQEDKQAHEAAMSCLKLLLSKGANPDATAPAGYRPLHVAAETGNRAMIDLLLEAGADVSIKNDQGVSAADIAATWGHKELVEILVKAEGGDRTVDDVLLAAEERDKAANPKAMIPEPEIPDQPKSEALKEQGNEAFKQGNYQQAYDLYKQALTHWTDSAALWSNSSAALLKLGRNDEALRDARIGRTVDPKFFKAWYREGAAAEALCIWEDAAAAYFEAASIDPTSMAADECEKAVVRCAKKARSEHALKKQEEEAVKGKGK